MSTHTKNKQNQVYGSESTFNPSTPSTGGDVRLADVASEATESFRRYAVQRPEVVAMWCLGIGFVLGWKLKPW